MILDTLLGLNKLNENFVFQYFKVLAAFIEKLDYPRKKIKIILNLFFLYETP